MKPRNLTPLLLALAAPCQAATFAEVAAKGDTIGTNYLFDGNASTGGGDYDSFNGTSEIGFFDRSWLLANPGGSGIDVSITGLAFGLPGSNNTDGNVITASVTYLGADGVVGGGDDVPIGAPTTATLVFTTAFDGSLAGRYEWQFDSPATGNIDGLNSVFRVTLTSFQADNGGNTYNMRFKTTSGTGAAAVKIDIAGTSTSSGLVDLDLDGLHDAYETNTGIYVSSFDTGTDPTKNDTDNDGLLDGVENNTRSYISASRTGTSPLKNDSDNDGLLDAVETNTGIFVSVNNTGTNPNTRDRDIDRLNDNFEVTNGLDPFTNADFDSDGTPDALEVLFYGSDPKNIASFPGDGISPAPGSFTALQDSGANGTGIPLDIPTTLGTAILNEAAVGGAIDADFNSGNTSFVLNFPNALPAAGSAVSITGFAWPVIGVPQNASGDILLQFYDPGADGVVDGIDKDTLVGTAKGTLTVTGASTIMYWNFTPITFTSSGTALMVKIQSTASLRIKAQDNFGSGTWYSNDGLSTFGINRGSLVSIGGTAVAQNSPRILTITRVGTTTSLTWDLGGAPKVTLQRSTTLGSFNNVPSKTATTDTSYSEISTDPKAFFRLATP